MATESGVKDKYFQHFIACMQEAANKLREEQRTRQAPSGMSKADEVRQMLRELRAQMPDSIFNPMLDVAGA